MKQVTVSVVIPFLNEEDCIPDFLEAVETYAAQAPFSLELLFVDDGSTDRSCMLLESHEPLHANMKLIRLSRNYGFHAAARAGLTKASGDCATFIGIDLQEPLSIITQMYKSLQTGFDVVCCQKAEVHIGAIEKWFSNAYTNLVRRFAVSGMPKGGCNSLMVSRKVLDEFNRHIEANSAIALQILNMGFRTTYVAIHLQPRNHGKSKWTLSKKIKAFIDAFVSFSYFPLRCISIIGIAFALCGFLYALYMIITKLIDPAFVVAGWATLISILLIGFGLTNIALGVIAEYLWRTLDTARNRPVFLIDEIIDIE